MTEQAPRKSFADKLRQLFQVVRDPDGGEYSPDHVATWIGANTDTTISASYIYMLRRGERPNPTKSHIEGLAAFFGMPPAFFFDEELGTRMSEELELLAALRDSNVRAITTRTAELTDDARRSVLAIVRELSWARRPSIPMVTDEADRNPAGPEDDPDADH